MFDDRMSLEEGRRVGSSFFAARATQGDDIRVNVPSLLLLLLFLLLLFFARVPVSSGERARKKCGFLCRRQRERVKKRKRSGRRTTTICKLPDEIKI